MKNTLKFITAMLCALSATASFAQLEEGEVKSVQTESTHTLNKQWYDRIDISGNIATGVLGTDTEDGGNLESLNYKSDDYYTDNFYSGHVYTDATLFLEVNAWENVGVFLEWFVSGNRSPWYFNKHSSNHSDPFRLGESYVHFKDVIGNGGLSIKLGTFDIPFGEEYNWQDKIDNPLILRTAAWPWGIDQGILFYGQFNNVGWVAAFVDDEDLDGSFEASEDKDSKSSKAAVLKFYGNPMEQLYTSLSYMANSETLGGSSALWLGNNSLFGVNAESYNIAELNAVYKMAKLELSINYGQLNVKYEDSTKDLAVSYYMLQPLYWITDKTYVAMRYSAITSDKGTTVIGGDPYQKAYQGFSSSVTGHNRAELGVGYKANHNTLLKVSYAQDAWTTDGATGIAKIDDETRKYFGFEAAIKF